MFLTLAIYFPGIVIFGSSGTISIVVTSGVVIVIGLLIYAARSKYPFRNLVLPVGVTWGFLGKTGTARVSEEIPGGFRQSVPVTVYIEKIKG